MPGEEVQVGSGGSMFEKVTALDVSISATGERIDRHGERIEIQDARLDSHDERLQRVETRVDKLELQWMSLENTIMKENRETRDSFTEQNKKLLGLLETSMGLSSGESERTHEYRVKRLESNTSIILKVAGAGGIIYLIAQAVIGALSGQ